jgi:hypothetical protein
MFDGDPGSGPTWYRMVTKRLRFEDFEGCLHIRKGMLKVASFTQARRMLRLRRI